MESNSQKTFFSVVLCTYVAALRSGENHLYGLSDGMNSSFYPYKILLGHFFKPIIWFVSVQTPGAADGSFPGGQWQVPSSDVEGAHVKPSKLNGFA